MMYFVILTVQRTVNGRRVAKTIQGIVAASLAETRGELLTQTRALMPEQFHKGEIAFFYCEPNILAVAS